MARVKGGMKFRKNFGKNEKNEKNEKSIFFQKFINFNSKFAIKSINLNNFFIEVTRRAG